MQYTNDLDGDTRTISFEIKSLQDDTLLSKVPAIANGSVAVIEDGSALAASCTPSALSIPAKIDEYLKVIGDAASKVK